MARLISSLGIASARNRSRRSAQMRPRSRHRRRGSSSALAAAAASASAGGGIIAAWRRKQARHRSALETRLVAAARHRGGARHRSASRRIGVGGISLGAASARPSLGLVNSSRHLGAQMLSSMAAAAAMASARHHQRHGIKHRSPRAQAASAGGWLGVAAYPRSSSASSQRLAAPRVIGGGIA